MHQPQKKRDFAQKLPLIGLLLLSPLAACDAPAVDRPVSPASSAEPSCGENGALEASIFGSVKTEFKWSAEEMDCQSMRRPDGEGIRLRFAGEVSGERLALIIAMPGLRPGDSAVEIPSNVTATVEGSGRFFSTPDLDSCWTEVTSHRSLPGVDNVYAIDGALFCIAPLGEINGDTAISIPQLSFSTIVNWSEK